MDKAKELYEELIAPVEERMIETVSRIVRNPEDAADVLQEILAYVWRKLKKIHRHPNPHAYIMRLCVSRSYDSLRRRSFRREKESPLTEELASNGKAFSSGDSLLETENVEAIHRAVSSLPDAQGQALLLRVMGNESYHAIGITLGCSEVTARSHVSKARARLAKILGELGFL